MSGDRWGIEGPPPEAYSRVTDPERFRDLHDFAVGLLGRLEATFDVERLEGDDLDDDDEDADWDATDDGSAISDLDDDDDDESVVG